MPDGEVVRTGVRSAGGEAGSRRICRGTDPAFRFRRRIVSSGFSGALFVEGHPFGAEQLDPGPDGARAVEIVRNLVAQDGAVRIVERQSAKSLHACQHAAHAGPLGVEQQVQFGRNDRIYDPESLYDAGIMMGFHQNADGALSWGYGQHYAKYDLLGRKVFNRRLPANYADFSHAMMPAENGGYFLRVASPDLRRADDTRVRTVRDVIIEVDASGEVVDEWRLFEILDPNRNIVLKSIDQGAVCLNIDTSQSGKTLSAEQLAKLEAQHAFGDIAGTGAGRNWAHVNSVDHDPVDDSIILSSRHQSAVVKIGRDKQVKWILAAPNGWRDGLKDKVLTPVGKDGRPLSCRIGKCEGGFDWTWTQHTAWKIDELSKGDIVYVSVFDNGDGRAFVQPEDQNEKYSRAVVYKIDQKAMTVEQVWEYGKERGHELYSPITSSVEYQADKNSVVVYWASIGTGSKTGPAPVLTEFRWGETKPAFEMHLKGGMGYRALPIDAQKAFVR